LAERSNLSLEFKKGVVLRDDNQLLILYIGLSRR